MEELVEQTCELLTKETEKSKMEGRRIFATSSFQTQSVPLLHILGTYFTDIPVLFLDTGFLFPETYAFKNRLKKRFGLNIISLKSSVSPQQQIDQATGLFQYALDPDKCCYMNKVKPLDDFLQEGDVWISGVRRDQTAVRQQMDIREEGPNGIVKFHPMLTWSGRSIYEYIKINNLPKHPLEDQGYISIGCIPCTHKWTGSDPRSGRWVGRKKTECGLHVKK